MSDPLTATITDTDDAERFLPDEAPGGPPTEAELLARLAACTREVCEDCGCEEYCVDYLRASLGLADTANAETFTSTCPVCDGSAVEVVYHSGARDWETGEYLDYDEYPCPVCDGTGRIAEPAGEPVEDIRTAAPAATPASALPAPWTMGIRELDSWASYYDTIQRIAGDQLTDEYRAHRDEVLLNIAQRHEARRHSYFNPTALGEVEILEDALDEWLRAE